MRESITTALIRDTGHDVAWWNERMAAQPGISDEGALRAWLAATGTSLLTPRRAFAAVKPATRTRADLVLRLDGATPGGRLLDGRNSAGGALNVRVALESVTDLDDEALDLLRRAYEASA